MQLACIVDATDRTVGLLEERGPTFGYPYSSDVKGSRHGRMRELRVQRAGRPIRIFYAWDPRRVCLLLIGGDKTGDKQFYARTLAWPMICSMNILRPYSARESMTKGVRKAASDGRRSFDELRAKMSPERRARNAAATKAMLAELRLQELRHTRELTQATLADTLECGQDDISKLERRADILVNTLRRYVEAMGGRLDIVATFPDGDVRIANLGELAESGR